MPNFCGKFLQGQDAFPISTQLTYRKETSYGTMLGGCCSLTINILIWGFLCIELISLAFTPTYNSTYIQDYLPVDNEKSYTLDLHKGIPTFEITTWDDENWELLYNSDSLFYSTFVFYDLKLPDPDNLKIVEAVPCVEYIPTIYPEEEATLILAAIGKGYDNTNYLCPKVESYTMLNEDAGIGLYIDILSSGTDHETQMIADTTVWVEYITEHFNIEKYSKSEKLSWVALEKDVYSLDASISKTVQFDITQITTTLYNFRLFDVSAVSFIGEWLGKGFGQDIETYRVQGSPTLREKYYNWQEDFTLQINFGQSRAYIEQEISVDSLDLILGLLGGYTAILWGMSGSMLAGYEGFKYHNSLIGAVYSASPDKNRDAPDDLKEAQGDIKHDLETEGRFFYSYTEYIWNWLLAKCCCCFKNTERFKARQKRYDSFEEAVDTLTSELDVQRVLNAVRLAEFMSVITLKSYQRKMIPRFRRYQVEEINPKNDKKQTVDPLAHLQNPLAIGGGVKPTSVEVRRTSTGVTLQLSKETADLREEFKNEFNPHDDVADLLILYEMTGYKLHGQNSDEFFMRFAGERRDTKATPPNGDDPEQAFLYSDAFSSINPRKSNK